MELTDKENLPTENSKSCQTEIAIPPVRSTPTQTNASDIATIAENEVNIASISQCSQTEIPSDNVISFRTEESLCQMKKRKFKVKMNA